MREILFRGQDIAGNWHYGVPLVFTDDYVCMTAPHTYNKKVEANTIGQYTGLTDKNGKKIFEGDIVNEYDMPETISNTGIVHWNELFAGWYISQTRAMYNHQYMSYEIIGNIHDNPELLEGGRCDHRELFERIGGEEIQ